MSVALTISPYPALDPLTENREIVELVAQQNPCFGWYTTRSQECLSCGIRNSCRTKQHTLLEGLLSRYERQAEPRPDPIVVPEVFLSRLRKRPFASTVNGALRCPCCSQDLVDGDMCYNVLTMSQGRPATLPMGSYHETCLVPSSPP